MCLVFHIALAAELFEKMTKVKLLGLIALATLKQRRFQTIDCCYGMKAMH